MPVLAALLIPMVFPLLSVTDYVVNRRREMARRRPQHSH
jgi:hypothetical protein